MLLYQYDLTLLPEGVRSVYKGASRRLPGKIVGGCGFVKCTFQDPTTQNHESESLAMRSGNLHFQIYPRFQNSYFVESV